MARVLGVVRLSRVSDETTSPERQRRSIQRWADQEGHVVVGWVEDIDVSGGVEPWKRPEFGKWLPSTIGKEVSAIEHKIAMEESRADEYDILCALKIDRLSRRVLHVHTLLEWCEKNGKEVATVEDGINLNAQMGKLLLSLIASFAEGELEAIKARAKSSYNHLVKEGRWRGGRTPYGYREEKQETGEGWKLVPDDYGTDTARTLREIVRRLIEGESANSIAQWLNEDTSKTPTSLDAQMIRSGKTPKGSRWTAANTSKVVRSRCVLGQMEVTEEVMVDGKKVKRTRVVRDTDGQPLQRAEPLITQEEWELANKKLDENTSHTLRERDIGFKVLTGALANIDPGTADGRLMLQVVGAMAEFERSLIKERTRAGLDTARAQGRTGGRPSVMNDDMLTVARARRAKGERAHAIARALGVSRATLYRHIGEGA
ncbi:recombinase family protein [Streptomyces europaeiscabiei]|uniref:recombinase family protein n=1 Tax=Streptomyces europaeiscabiei TaxID=146819 RepID=UPI0029A8F72A|nr:recombinase family protein [Streptomyces europaeiscabiei]MDX3585212.1 recombinase family protein [Streptomyces europaeiscabiei]